MATPGECALRITVGRHWSDHSCVVSVNDFDSESVTSSVEFQCIKTLSADREGNKSVLFKAHAGPKWEGKKECMQQGVRTH